MILRNQIHIICSYSIKLLNDSIIKYFSIFYFFYRTSLQSNNFIIKMQKYQIIQKAGSGNFSDVYKARNILTDQIVAIKEMKNLQQLQQLALKQLKIVSNLDHPNIIKLKQIIRTNKQIRVVFQFMDENLLQLYSSFKNGATQNQLRCILYQSALALEYLHSNHIIHRDIKPQNILINRKSALIKIIDFGLAREQYMATTDYVATRWYRSPQNLIGLRKSTTAIDIFALGCVAVQLFTLNPLFPGDDTIDQLNKIFNILGTPTYEDWTKGYLQLKKKNVFYNPKPKVSLKNLVIGASCQLIDLLEQMLILNPENRITAKNMLCHPFFRNAQKVIPQNIYKQAEKIRERIETKQKNKISLSKVMPIIENRSPKHKNEYYDNYRKQTNDSVGRIPLKISNRQQPQNSLNNQNNNNKVYESRSKKYNYLSKQKLVMPNISKIQSQSICYKNYQTINPNLNDSIDNTQRRLVFKSPTTDRKGFIQRNTNQKIVAAVKYVPKQIIYNRIDKNKSLLNDSNPTINRSVQKINIDVSINNSRSFNQLKNYSYINNHHPLGSPYKRNNFRGY